MNSKYLKELTWMVAILIIYPMSLMASSSVETPSEGPVFTLNTGQSTLGWKGTKSRGGHYGVIEMVDGSINTDGDEIIGGNFTIDMNTIVCEDLTNENMNQRLIGHLVSEDFFYTEKYPKAFFKVTGVEKQMSEKDGFSANHMVTGDLTIRGNTKQISFPADITMEEDRIYAKTGEIMLDRTQWNVNTQTKKVIARMTDRYIDDVMIVSLDLKFDVN